MQYLDETGLEYLIGKIKEWLGTKVDKQDNKGLSTNDFTTTLKNKLDGIAAGAEVNVQSDWNQTDTSKDDYIKNKPSSYTPSAHSHPFTEITGSLSADQLSAGINNLTTRASDPMDSDYIVAQYAGGGTSHTSYHRRPVINFWNYIKSKADNVYAQKSHRHSTQNLDYPSYLTGISDVTLRPLFSNNRANRLAFLPASQVIIEKTTDGGKTWVSYGASDTTKAQLFSEVRPTVSIPLDPTTGVKSTKCGIRVTITAMKYNVPSGTDELSKYNYWNGDNVLATERYCQLMGSYFWVNSVDDKIGLKVEAACGNSSTKWDTLFDSDARGWAGMSGWSGNDWAYWGPNNFGGGTSQKSQYWNYRYTFFTRPKTIGGQLSSSYANYSQAIFEIRGYGDTWWNKSDNYMANDHLYGITENKTAVFPAIVTATSFTENGTSIADKYAAKSHGNHVPTLETANNAKFLRNDNTWQTVTPANIGAATSSHSHDNYVPTTRTVNSKALSSNITLNAADVGAAASSHTHSKSEITDFPTLATVATSGSYNDLSNKPTIDSALSSSSTNAIQNSAVNTALGNKVDKVSGKGLSTNDYTTTEKNKLEGIASGAQVNVIEAVKVNGTALTVASKSVDIDLSGYAKKTDIASALNFRGTKASVSAITGLTSAEVGDVWLCTSDHSEYVCVTKVSGTASAASWEKLGFDVDLSGYATTTALTNGLSGKVDKVSGKGLSTNDFTTTLKNKLDGIASGAEVNVQSDWNQTNTSADDYIKNKPSLATVATSGSYNDLTNKPTIPSEVTESTVSGWGFTKNTSNLVLGETSTTAYRGDRGKTAYDHSQTTHAPANAQPNVQSDWNATYGDALILNKPTIPNITDTYSSTSTDGMSGKALSSAIDSIQIGGVNRLAFPVSKAGVSQAKSPNVDISNDGIITINSFDRDTYFRLASYDNFVKGETYTLSCEVSGIDANITTQWGFPMFHQLGASIGMLYLKNGKCSCTFVCTEAYADQKILFLDDDGAARPTTNSTPVIIKNWKLEIGNKATAWVKAPEELYSAGTGLSVSNNQFYVSQANSSTILDQLMSADGTPTDSSFYISQQAAGESNTYYKRTHLALWNYIKGKISSALGLTATSYGGTAAAIKDLSSNDVATSSDVKRKVWFSYSNGTTGRPALSDSFTYQTSTETLNSTKFSVDEHVTLEYSSSTESLNFVFK